MVPQIDQDSVLSLPNDVSLILRDDGLVVKDKDLARHSRVKLCGLPIGKAAAEITIPYYNILWASAVSIRQGLLIDYATEKSKTQLQRSTLIYRLDDVAMATVQPWVEMLKSRAYAGAELQRRVKVIINPHAGPGDAKRICEEEVVPIFETARMQVDVIETEQQGDATAICRLLDITKYDTVVVCSGDGLAYEAFNGLGQRPDARTALQQIAVAHIPCGSGNAMSCNLNGSHYPGPAALAVVKGKRISIDLMSFTQGPRRLLSFLSQSVGIIAESDLGTEDMRWLGAKRFDIGVIQRIFTKKVYPCDIAIRVEIEDKAQIKAHYARIHSHGPPGQKEEGKGKMIVSADEDAGEGLPPLRFGTVNDNVPDDWQTVSYDKLGNFYCGNMAYMAPNANFFTAACINDGMMDVVINDGDLPAHRYVHLMTAVASGRFFDNSLVSYRKVVAYRFTPRDQADGYISVDGERVPFEPFQVEVHPGLGTVLSKDGKYEAPGPRGWQRVSVS
ncbi:sphingoid long chain base kinase-like protein [Nemania sp. FL0916]|nr:sphingoid long chain base kinase-like protein [Nemania sp. FL0916]